jgi:hypothetical protein
MLAFKTFTLEIYIIALFHWPIDSCVETSSEK